MESLAAVLVAGTLTLAFLRLEKAALAGFLASLIFVSFVFWRHLTEALPLSF